MTERVWRLIIDERLPGATNMAIDEAVLASRRSGACPATLRLYRWRVPTVTLGRFQPIEQVDLEACGARGFDVVRRPTGGRGVLHDDELTYSVVAHVDDEIPRGVADSYRHLCEALAETYRILGVDARLTSRSRGIAASGACYLHATRADLSLGAAKLSGSAQVWSGDAVLQHGSFVRARDVAAEAEVFRLGEEGRASLLSSTATLADALGDAPAPGEIADAAADAFARVLGIRLEPGRLTDEERTLADSLVQAHVLTAVARVHEPSSEV
jgi:lipoate-protein ligase A